MFRRGRQVQPRACQWLMWFDQELRQSGQLTGIVTINDEREKMASSMTNLYFQDQANLELTAITTELMACPFGAKIEQKKKIPSGQVEMSSTILRNTIS